MSDRRQTGYEDAIVAAPGSGRVAGDERIAFY